MANLENSNTAYVQEKDLKINFMKMIDVLNKEMNAPLKRNSGKHKSLEEMNYSLKESKVYRAI